MPQYTYWTPAYKVMPGWKIRGTDGKLVTILTVATNNGRTRIHFEEHDVPFILGKDDNIPVIANT